MVLASLLLTLGSGILSGIAAHNQGTYERDQAKKETTLANEQLSDQLDVYNQQKEAARGTLLADAFATGIQGASVNTLIGRTVNDYQKIITRGEEQITRNNEDLDAYVKASKWNEALNIGSSILGTGSSIYSQGMDFNLWGPGKTNPLTGEKADTWWNTDRITKGWGSFASWNGGY